MGILDFLISNHTKPQSSDPVVNILALSELQKSAELRGSPVEQLLQAQAPIMLIDASGVIVYLNQTLIHLFQQHTAAFNQYAAKVQLDKLINQSLQNFLQNCGATNRGQGYVLQLGLVLLQVDLIALHDRAGNKTGQVAQWQDLTITSRHECLAAAIDQQYACCVLSLDGTVQMSNIHWQQLLGAESQGKPINQLLAGSAQQQQSLAIAFNQAKQGKTSNVDISGTTAHGHIAWLAATLIPQLDQQGRVLCVHLYARNITEEKLRQIDQQGQMVAISRSSAVIEFTLDGTILTANNNFLGAVGYELKEIQGKHHSMFVTPEYRNSSEYQSFWQRLKSGEFFSDEYLRVAKGGREIWIQASYNPIFDSDGKPFKVVKYATDITQRKLVVNEIKRVMLSLSEGDLTTHLKHTFTGEFTELGQAISSFIDHLKHTIEDISAAANTIQNAASEISTGSTDLSSRTEQQASNLEETASSMEELTGTISQNTNNAKQANLLAASATEVAVNGGELIDKVVHTMSSINESSQKISDIIGVIDGIAFQTNILALNAAVEAARAGEQGRGFAVVASEVRNLAQRSANAAKDIKALISDSVGKIRQGNELVEQSGSTMKQIVTSIKRVNDLMAEISAASVEQATGIEEISRAVNQMDEMTQQNAALVEESAAAAENLLHQADQLNAHVATFKLADSAQPRAYSNAPSVHPKARPALAARSAKSSSARPQTPPKPARLQTESTAQDEWESF